MNFAGFASQKKKIGAVKKNSEITFVSNKNTLKFNTNFNHENESLGKDFISVSTLKMAASSFILLTFLAIFLLKNLIVNAKVVIKRLKYNYWCLFKMLYPKHVFW